MAGNDGRSVVAARLAEDFLGRLLVDCPVCGGFAVILPRDPERSDAAAARRMVCRDCGATRDKAETAPGVAIDPFMGLNARLRAETRQGDLVAWNEAHLDYLETYLAGRLRVQQAPVDPTGPRNRTIVSRLPAWAKAAKNRSEVLKAIARLKVKKI